MGSEDLKRKTRAKPTVLLDYRSWILEVDHNFPSANYIVRKKSDQKYKQAAYCSSLEDGLKTIYDAMLLDNVNRKNGYGARFLDLKNLILETKMEFKALLDVTPKIKAGMEKGRVEK
ncbi:MAG TPA: hypothetical protein ENI49_04150 [Thermoplasmatales archaeon]|nr:hypothetical protein [Thermoplasmatales archaeon]